MKWVWDFKEMSVDSWKIRQWFTWTPNFVEKEERSNRSKNTQFTESWWRFQYCMYPFVHLQAIHTLNTPGASKELFPLRRGIRRASKWSGCLKKARNFKMTQKIKFYKCKIYSITLVNNSKPLTIHTAIKRVFVIRTLSYDSINVNVFLTLTLGRFLPKTRPRVSLLYYLYAAPP